MAKVYDENFEKRRAYMLNNWQAYNLTDTKEEFISLLNVCEAVGETIDSIHDAYINGGFCGISACDEWNDEREIVDSLLYFSTFYTVEDFKERLYEELNFAYEYDNEHGGNEETESFIHTYINNEDNDTEITETHDGYVITIHC